jgi:hypothetical protein
MGYRRAFFAVVLCGAASGLAAADPGPAAVVTPPADEADVALSAFPGRIEATRSVAVNPANPLRAVAAVDVGGRCRILSSGDGGRTWPTAVLLPTKRPGQACIDPVVAYAPHGGRAYAAYKGGSERGLLFSVSTDNGATWSAPGTIQPPPDRLIGGGRQKLATPLTAADGRFVYLATYAYVGESFFGLIFTRSQDRGQTWSPWRAVAILSVFYPPYNQGMGVAGGPGGSVLVAWDESLDPSDPTAARLRIRLARSADFGTSFAPSVTVARELLFGGGRPDVKLGADGAAHIVYARTRARIGDEDDLDIRYVTSTGAPYASWSPPLTLNHGGIGTVQSDPLLAVEPCGAASILHVAWTDGRRGADLRDIFHVRRLVQAGEPWSADLRLSDPTPPAVLPGEPWLPESWSTRNSALAAGPGTIVAAWTDRRDGTAPDTDAFASPVRSGITCP